MNLRCADPAPTQNSPQPCALPALDETARLSRLARDLLTAADAGTRTEPPSIDLRTYLNRAAGRYRHSLGGQLTVECPPEQQVRADPDDLDRIICNLIDNAAEHGAPPIAIKARPDSSGTVAVHVRDHGAGFEPAFLPHAFDRFTRADSARTIGGTGLGLAIVETLIHRNHGTVAALNHPEGGAEVLIRLPSAPS